MVLWEEYRESHPDGYGYSRFCDRYREFERRLSPVMRQHHVAGDKVFVDYSGKKIAIVDPSTGEVRDAEIFVAVLGASNYTYAEATWTQTLPDWIEAHVRMFCFFGGVPRLLVPDNLKSGVHKASFYDPEINRSYAMMAAHYGVGVLPARPAAAWSSSRPCGAAPLRAIGRAHRHPRSGSTPHDDDPQVTMPQGCSSLTPVTNPRRRRSCKSAASTPVAPPIFPPRRRVSSSFREDR
jgi:hypothetical protein